MASENIGSAYPTKIPGYDDAADIQAALRLYHYGSESYDPANTNPSQIPSQSVAGYLKSIEEDIATLEATGVGSDFSEAEPINPVDGFIWVDADSLTPNFATKNWTLHDSGTLSGSSLSVTSLDGDVHNIIFKDFYVSAPSGLLVQVNSATVLDEEDGEFETDPLNPKTMIITIDMANSAASVKAIKINGNSSVFYKNSLPVSTFSYTLTEEFSGGTYEVWSYR